MGRAPVVRTPILGTVLQMPFGRVVTFVAEILAIGSAIGAILSIVLNTIRFNHWGLSFTDVANASDILMSGVSVGIDLAKLLLFLAIGAFISEAALWIVSRIFSRRRINPVAPAVIISLTAILLLVYLLRKYLRWVDDTSFIGIIDLVVLGLAVGAIACPLFFSRWRVIPSKGDTVWVMLAVIFVASALISVKDLDNTADHAAFRWLSTDNFCVGAPTVVWIGGSALVAKCATSDHTWTYIIRDRGQGVIGHRRAVVRFVRSQRLALYRPLNGLGDHKWELAAGLKAPIYVDRKSVKLINGEAQFIAAYFPSDDTNRPSNLAGTSVQISDQLIRCVFPYSDRLVDLWAFSRSGRRIRLDETMEDKRYDTTITAYDYELAQFVCENLGERKAMDSAKSRMLGDIFKS